jgi:hypothetical protein
LEAVETNPPAETAETMSATATPESLIIATLEVTPEAVKLTPVPTRIQLQAEDWRTWPVLSIVSGHAKEIYQLGLTLGNDPHHFSVLGDCQSEYFRFMGRYETDPDLQFTLPQHLLETVKYFNGSFARLSPTVRPGTTAGAVLWVDWVDRVNIPYCKDDETPLDCELRVWKPSIIFINLGTHWEARNYQYLTRILDTLIEKGVLPILATKADDREGDERINLQIAETAVKYDIPLWNFWQTVQDLPNGGLKPETDVAELYLTDEGLEVHRYSALQALDTVWRQVITP